MYEHGTFRSGGGASGRGGGGGFLARHLFGTARNFRENSDGTLRPQNKNAPPTNRQTQVARFMRGSIRVFFPAGPRNRAGRRRSARTPTL